MSCRRFQALAQQAALAEDILNRRTCSSLSLMPSGFIQHLFVACALGKRPMRGGDSAHCNSAYPLWEGLTIDADIIQQFSFSLFHELVPLYGDGRGSLFGLRLRFGSAVCFWFYGGWGGACPVASRVIRSVHVGNTW